MAPPDEKKSGSKAGLIAGTAAAALGASLLPGAIPLFKIQGRRLLARAGVKSAAKHASGKFVADYIDAAQGALNSGAPGRVAGTLLKHAKQNPAGRASRAIGGDFATEHYARFRAGHMPALDHWGWEVGAHLDHKVKIGEMTAGAAARGMKRLNRGREATHAAIKTEIGKGLNEREAIRAVTSSADKHVQDYFRTLAVHKAGAAQHYGKLAIAAPVLTAGGGAAAIASLPDRKKEKKALSALVPGMILFNAVVKAAHVAHGVNHAGAAADATKSQIADWLRNRMKARLAVGDGTGTGGAHAIQILTRLGALLPGMIRFARPRDGMGQFAGGETAGSPDDMTRAYGHPEVRPAAMMDRLKRAAGFGVIGAAVGSLHGGGGLGAAVGGAGSALAGYLTAKKKEPKKLSAVVKRIEFGMW